MAPDWPEAEYVMDYRALQALIGAIAILLVPVVYVGNWLIFTRHLGGCLGPNRGIPGSLSAFYYTHMRNLFVGAMCAMGVFFATYRGYDRWDNRITNVAGLAAICIALSPTLPPFYSQSPGGPNLFFTASNQCGPVTLITYNLSPHQSAYRWVHVVSLIVLFMMVFLMVLVQFTRTDKPVGERKPANSENLISKILAWWNGLFKVEQPKKRRNKFYVICAGGIALSALLAIAGPWIDNTAPWLLIAEVGAFWSFGFAWYVKGAASSAIQPERNHVVLRTLSRTIPRGLAG
jgi:hypothetical protein